MDELLKNRRMGRVAAGLVGITVVGGVLSFIYARNRWWLPELASEQAGAIDGLFMMIMAIIGVAFVVTHVFLFLFIWRFADDDEREGSYWHENLTIEVLWTLLPAAVFVILLIMGGNIWASMQSQPAGIGEPAEANQEVVTLDVVGQQFAWNIRYPGADGRLGTAGRQFMSNDNPLGLNPNDPAGEDDVTVVNQLVMPVDQKIHLRLRAVDVIHSFFLPNFRVKQDAVPGRVTEIWLEPTEMGEYEAACAELCGAGHFAMRSQVSVVSAGAYQSWMQQQASAGDGDGR